MRGRKAEGSDVNSDEGIMRNVDIDEILVESWQIISAWRKTLGDSFLQKVYKRSLRQLQRWSANPDFAESAERNPLDRIATILRTLLLAGYEAIAVATVSYLARQIGYRLVPEGNPVPDKEDWRDEIIDDYPAVSEFHRVCQQYKAGTASPGEVQQFCEDAIRELLETKVSVLRHGRR